jgi:hypothetical protein
MNVAQNLCGWKATIDNTDSAATPQGFSGTPPIIYSSVPGLVCFLSFHLISFYCILRSNLHSFTFIHSGSTVPTCTTTIWKKDEEPETCHIPSRSQAQVTLDIMSTLGVFFFCLFHCFFSFDLSKSLSFLFFFIVLSGDYLVYASSDFVNTLLRSDVVPVFIPDAIQGVKRVTMNQKVNAATITGHVIVANTVGSPATVAFHPLGKYRFNAGSVAIVVSNIGTFFKAFAIFDAVHVMWVSRVRILGISNLNCRQSIL